MKNKLLLNEIDFGVKISKKEMSEVIAGDGGAGTIDLGGVTIYGSHPRGFFMPQYGVFFLSDFNVYYNPATGGFDSAAPHSGGSPGSGGSGGDPVGYFDSSKGIGKVVSGSGTSASPFLINVPIYYGDDLTMAMQTAIMDSAYQMNHLDSVTVNGKVYKLNIELNEGSNTSVAMNLAGIRGSAGLITKGTLEGDVLGDARSVTARIDEDKVASRGFKLDTVITHEIEHLLGFSNTDLGGTIDHTHSTGTDTNTNMHEGASINDPGMTIQDLDKIIRARLAP